MVTKVIIVLSPRSCQAELVEAFYKVIRVYTQSLKQCRFVEFNHGLIYAARNAHRAYIFNKK
jgi:cyanate lyase